MLFIDLRHSEQVFTDDVHLVVPKNEDNLCACTSDNMFDCLLSKQIRLFNDPDGVAIESRLLLLAYMLCGFDTDCTICLYVLTNGWEYNCLFECRFNDLLFPQPDLPVNAKTLNLDANSFSCLLT